MKKIFLSILSLCFLLSIRAQETVSPAPPESQPILITNATVHVGNGEVIQNGSILIKDGKIAAVGQNLTAPAGAEVINAQGKQQAAQKLVEAAEILAPVPQAMQLRYLATLFDIASERSSTIVFPFPIDLTGAARH